MNREKKVKLFDCLMKAVNKTTNTTGLKIVKIKKVPFRNVTLGHTQTARDIYILGREGSDKPLIINSIKCGLINNPRKTRIISLRNRLCHPNTSSDGECYQIPLLFGNLAVKLLGQIFCNPVTSHHVLNIDGVENILVGQLSGISDDAYGCPDSCSVDDEDCPIESRDDDTILRKNSNILQLITQQSNIDADTIRNLRLMDIPKNDDEIMVKYLRDDEYTCINKASLDYDEISSYYPIITYADLSKIDTNIPRKSIDVGVFGVGSGGTAILDQIGRSNYFNSYLLNDMDTIEYKNVNNQWYNITQVGNYKVDSSKCILENINPNRYTSLSIDKKCCRYETIPTAYYEFKYVISGFDSIATRQKLLSDFKKGDLLSRFLIDCRYLDNECSIYFIDLNNTSEVDYYERLLNADGVALKDNTHSYISTPEQFLQWFAENEYFTRGCTLCLCELGMHDRDAERCGGDCASDKCMKFLSAQFEKIRPKIKITDNESSCVRHNYIDIYKYVGSIVFSAIREIENERDKPFTHIECQSYGIPSLVVVRK